jgi:hypothetical protein
MLSVVVAVAIATSVIVGEAKGKPLSETSSSVGDHLDGFIAEASERFGIPAAWIRAIIREEAGEDAGIASRKDAIGLMQLTPEARTELRLRYALGTDPSDLRDNILASAALIREIYDRYGSKRFLPAYVMGPTRYDEHLRTGTPPSAETQTHIAVLAPLIKAGPKDGVNSAPGANVVSWRKAPLFVAQTERSSSDRPLAPGVPPERPSKFQTSADGSALVPRPDGLFARRGMESRPQ